MLGWASHFVCEQKCHRIESVIVIGFHASLSAVFIIYDYFLFYFHYPAKLLALLLLC